MLVLKSTQLSYVCLLMRNEQRPPLIRRLRALGRKLGVQDVSSDEVGRVAVKNLLERIRKTVGHKAEKKEAQR